MRWLHKEIAMKYISAHIGRRVCLIKETALLKCLLESCFCSFLYAGVLIQTETSNK